jgi:hypothetical protein
VSGAVSFVARKSPQNRPALKRDFVEAFKPAAPVDPWSREKSIFGFSELCDCLRIPLPQGTFRPIVTNVGRGVRWTQAATQDERSDQRTSKSAWSWPHGAEVKLAVMIRK